MSDSANIVFQGTRFNVERVQQQGRIRDIVRHPGAAVILPLLDQSRICLIKNYRVAVGETLVELPAGTLEPKEEPEITAARELKEETGYKAKNIKLLCKYYPSPGILDEQMYLYLATNLTEGSPERETGEEIENHVVHLDQVKDMIQDGSIRDGKTITGLLYYLNFCFKD